MLFQSINDGFLIWTSSLGPTILLVFPPVKYVCVCVWGGGGVVIAGKRKLFAMYY